VIERHRARMQNAGKDMMRRRKALAEHPFGTLKCRAGYRHFLLRRFDKVRGEWSLMALCYNFSRVLRIIGLGHGWRCSPSAPPNRVVGILSSFCGPIAKSTATLPCFGEASTYHPNATTRARMRL
jgi:hypothetical protein